MHPTAVSAQRVWGDPGFMNYDCQVPAFSGWLKLPPTKLAKKERNNNSFYCNFSMFMHALTRITVSLVLVPSLHSALLLS